MDPGPTEFRARPFVCGVLGDATPDQRERLHRAVPGLVTIHDAPGVLLLGARPLAAYRHEPRLSAWAFGDHEPASSADWRAAAIDTESPGLADLGDRVVLHAGALGLIDLFTRRIGETSWFASRMEPLLSLDTGPLEVDWEAWASILAFDCPVGDMTPFRAVRRLQGARTLVMERATGRIRADAWSPPWQGLAEVAPDAGDAREVLDQLRTVVGRISPVPHSIALSGGHDSRLVAIVARDAGIPMSAVTTTKDDGRNDPEVAAELAVLLGIPYRFVDSGLIPYASYGELMRRRTHGMIALNTWTAPLGEALRSEGRPVLTDMIGGVLLGGANISRAMETMPPGHERRLALMAMLQRLPVVGQTITEQAMPWVLDSARERWLGAVSHLAGDANELPLSMIETRDARGIGALHHWGMGPRDPSRDTRQRPRDAAGRVLGGHRQEDEGRVQPGAAAPGGPGHRHPSHQPRPGVTVVRDAQPQGQRRGDRRIRADVERACAVPDLVPEGMLRYLELGRWAGPSRTDRLLRRGPKARPSAFGGYRMTEMARLSLPIAHLGAWIDTHRDRLASIDPPWRSRRRR